MARGAAVLIAAAFGVGLVYRQYRYEQSLQSELAAHLERWADDQQAWGEEFTRGNERWARDLVTAVQKELARR